MTASKIMHPHEEVRMNGQILAANEGPLGSAPLSRLLRPLAIPRQMRHDAEQALDDHQLSPVVNLMLFAADQHLEAAFVPWTGPSACYELDRPRFGELLDPIAPPRRRAALPRSRI